MQDYYIMYSLSDLSISDEKWRYEYAKSLPCGHIYEACLYDPIVVMDGEFSRKCVMGIISSPWTFYFRRDFLEIIYSELLGESATFGNIVSKNKESVTNDWKTAYIPRITIRGGESSIFWICQRCKQKFYHHQNQPYILENDIGVKRIAFSDSGMIFNGEIYNKIISSPDWIRMRRKISIKKITVAPYPFDGLPLILDETPASSFRGGPPCKD